MKVRYRGYQIEVTREECAGGWPTLYYSIFREDDCLCCLESFEDSDERVMDKIDQLKRLVDSEIETGFPFKDSEDDLDIGGEA